MSVGRCRALSATEEDEAQKVGSRADGRHILVCESIVDDIGEEFRGPILENCASHPASRNEPRLQNHSQWNSNRWLKFQKSAAASYRNPGTICGTGNSSADNSPPVNSTRLNAMLTFLNGKLTLAKIGLHGNTNPPTPNHLVTKVQQRPETDFDTDLIQTWYRRCKVKPRMLNLVADKPQKDRASCATYPWRDWFQD